MLSAASSWQISSIFILYFLSCSLMIISTHLSMDREERGSKRRDGENNQGSFMGPSLMDGRTRGWMDQVNTRTDKRADRRDTRLPTMPLWTCQRKESHWMATCADVVYILTTSQLPISHQIHLCLCLFQQRDHSISTISHRKPTESEKGNQCKGWQRNFKKNVVFGQEINSERWKKTNSGPYYL